MRIQLVLFSFGIFCSLFYSTIGFSVVAPLSSEALNINKDGYCSRRKDHYYQLVRNTRSTLLLKAKEDNYNEVSDDDEMMEFLRSFKSRQKEVLQKEEQKLYNLRNAACRSGVTLVLPDWVRRLDVDYPLVVCGSSSDDIYIAHIETGQVLGCTGTSSKVRDGTDLPTSIPNSALTQERIEHTIHQLYGKYDGGGTLSVAVHGSLLCESRRSGGVHVWRLNKSNNSNNDGEENNKIDLISQGFMPSLQDCLVTTMKLTENYLFVGTDGGTVEAYAIDTDGTSLPLTLRMQPDMLWKVGGNRPSDGTGQCVVLSLDVNTELGCAVVTTDTGSVDLLSLEEELDEESPMRKPIGSFVPPFDGTERRSYNVFPTSATIVTSNMKNDEKNNDDDNNNDNSNLFGGSTKIQVDKPKTYSIACGANDGSLFIQKLRMESGGYYEINHEQPFDGKPHILMPKHFASIKCMASPAPGLLITGGLDGTLRLWDTDKKRDKFLYQFVGYKVWLGSIWTDGIRIVTDGADNTVIVHDFSETTNDSSNSNKPPEDRSEDNDL